MAGLSISGAGSGFDVAAIVTQLMTAESRSLIPLTKEASSFNSLLSAYSSLKSSFSTFQTALNTLTNTTFSAQKMTVSNLGAGTTTGTTADPFTAVVNTDTATKSLSQIIKSEGIAAGTTFTSGDSIAIQVGSEPPKFITLTEDKTLEGLKKAINDAQAGVTASITKDDDGEHLVLEANGRGTANTMRVSANGSLSMFGYNTSSTSPTTMTQTQAARDTTIAAAGVHDISVAQLAQAHKLKTEGFASDATFGSGILAIKTGTGTTTLINPKNPTLAGVRDAINASDAGVTASIINDGNKAHLVISAKEAGANNAIKITGTESLASFSYDPATAPTTAQSAAVPSGQTFDGASGALTLKVGNTTSTLTLSGAGQTLSNIQAQINAANAGVTASIVNEGSDSRIVLTPANAGTPVTLTGTGDFAALNNPASTTGMSQMAAAQDAKVFIDGVAVTSHTNEIKDAISGITLTLNKTTTANDEFKLNVSNDKSTVQSSVTTFVDAYNALAKTLNTMTAYDAEKKTAGSLQGDSGARSLITQLRATMMEAIEGNGTMNTLSSIGVAMQKDGTFKIDSIKLNTAATDNFTGLSKLLTSEDGIITKLKTLVTDVLGDKGIITERTASIQKSIDLNTKRQEEMQARLVQMEERYTKRYNALDLTLANMQSMQAQLTTQLASISKLNTR
jgi:flagellar hook-associated protein 2